MDESEKGWTRADGVGVASRPGGTRMNWLSSNLSRERCREACQSRAAASSGSTDKRRGSPRIDTGAVRVSCMCVYSGNRQTLEECEIADLGRLEWNGAVQRPASQSTLWSRSGPTREMRYPRQAQGQSQTGGRFLACRGAESCWLC